MLVPAPLPTYTLAPDIAALSGGQQAVLDACLTTLTGRLSGVLVESAVTTDSHHVLELITPAGRLIAMERVHACGEAAAAA